MTCTSRVMLICMALLGLHGCVSMPVPLGGQEQQSGICSSDPDIVARLQSLKVGMCESEVFEILGITHDTSNISSLDTTTVYEHVSLLQKAPEVSVTCNTPHDTEVPFVGHRTLCRNLPRAGYFKGLKWVQRTMGENSYYDFLFYRGAFISYAEGGVKNVDSKESVYPWEGLFSNPYSTAGSQLR